MKQSRKDAVYKFIVECKVKNEGTPPSLREISKECNISSTSEVSRCLKALEDDGKILLIGEHGVARSIVVIGGKYIAPEGFEKVQHETV